MTSEDNRPDLIVLQGGSTPTQDDTDFRIEPDMDDPGSLDDEAMTQEAFTQALNEFIEEQVHRGKAAPGDIASGVIQFMNAKGEVIQEYRGDYISAIILTNGTTQVLTGGIISPIDRLKIALSMVALSGHQLDTLDESFMVLGGLASLAREAAHEGVPEDPDTE